MELNKSKIAVLLKAEYGDTDITVLDTVDSTSTYLRQLLSNGKSGRLAVTADTQTAGRGRQGKSFFSPSGTGLYISICAERGQFSAPPSLLTVSAAVSTARAISAVCGKETAVKWVNDIFLGGKKICGILTERVTPTDSREAFIVGIGINIATVHFPDDIKSTAASLAEAQFDRNIYAAAVINSFYDTVCNFSQEEVLNEYRERSCVLGKAVTFTRNGTLYSGIAKTINDDASLTVATPQGDFLLNSGEISIKLST